MTRARARALVPRTVRSRSDPAACCRKFMRRTCIDHELNLLSYCPQDLGRLKHQQLTSPTAVLEVDFLKTGAAHLAPLGSSSAHTTPPVSTTYLSVKRSGRADSVAVWFDLWLDGERGECDVVSTRPERRTDGDASGWVRWNIQEALYCWLVFCLCYLC